jgi:uncharacterized protein (DUF3820 family)
MQYAYNAHDKEIDAWELSTGYIRSDTYKCIHCGKHVSFVSESDRCKPFFRHRNDESCIGNSCYSRQQKEQDVHDIICNRKSDFHLQWQNIFPQDCVEVKYKDKRADVCIDLCEEWQIRQGQNVLLNAPPLSKLFIEIQHSSISNEEVKHRVSIYITDTASLLWIIDISSCLIHIEHIVLLNTEHYRLRFPKHQPSCLRHLLNLHYQRYTCGTPWVILDYKKQLFLIKRIPKLDCQFLEVHMLKLEEFINSFNDIVILNNYLRVDVVQSTNTIDYKNYIISLEDIRVQNEVNKVIAILENTPFGEIQHLIDDIYCYLSKITNKSKIIYKMLNVWLDKYKKIHFSEPMSFGKYKGGPLWSLSDNYINWVLENCKRIDENIQDKLEIIKSINKQWLYECFFYNNDCNADYLLEKFSYFSRAYKCYEIEHHKIKLQEYSFIEDSI